MVQSLSKLQGRSAYPPSLEFMHDYEYGLGIDSLLERGARE